MNYNDIKKLIDDMGNSKVDSLDIEFPDGIKISMKKNQFNGLGQENKLNQINENINKSIDIVADKNIEDKKINNSQSQLESEQEDSIEYKFITSPMVGTFYDSSSPSENAFVKAGDKVKKGDVLCIIEAMKLMNEIEAEEDGEIVEILVKNEEMVDFSKPLFKIK